MHKRLRDGALMTSNRLETMLDEELFFMKADQNRWAHASQYHKLVNVESHMISHYDQMEIKVKIYTQQKKNTAVYGERYINQEWEFLNSRDTLNVGSNMKLKTSPTKIPFGDSIRIFLQGDVEQYPRESDFVVRFPERFPRENFNSDFSNHNDVLIKNISSLTYNDSLPEEKVKVDSLDHPKPLFFI